MDRGFLIKIKTKTLKLSKYLESSPIGLSSFFKHCILYFLWWVNEVSDLQGCLSTILTLKENIQLEKRGEDCQNN